MIEELHLQPLPKLFYDRDTVAVAKDLLGKYIVHHKQIGKIVEVEAYLGPHDLACHASKGLTNRTRIMFGPAGYAYVYMIYGIHHCFNVVTEKEGHPSAVLIRAIEPIQHINAKTNGPGLLCKAMNIDKRLNGHDLASNHLFLATDNIDYTYAIIKRPRIGVDYAKHWAKKPLRFYLKDNPFISKK